MNPISVNSMMAVLPIIGIGLSVFAVVFLFLAAVHKEWGNAAVASATLVIGVVGWLISVSQGYIALPTQLEISDNTDTTIGANIDFTWVHVLNRGPDPARNCMVEVTHSLLPDKDFRFIGYALFQREVFPAYTESKFWLIKAVSSGSKSGWDVYAMLRDVTDYHQDNQTPITYSIAPGDHYLWLTMVTDNGRSAPVEFIVHVPSDRTQLPKVEAIK